MDSKAALLNSIVLDTLDAFRTDFDTAIAGIDDPSEKLRRATESYALRHMTHWRETLVVTDSLIHLEEPALTTARARRRENEWRFREIILEGQESGAFQVHSARFASFAIRETCVSMARIYKEEESPSEYEIVGEYPEHGEYHGEKEPSPEVMAVWHGELALKVVGATTL
ncbi:hypothetical protein Pd630_LPD16162 (plasmid) [Rhodococcus opacus PD630]|nr:hypothetical protein Pd630_LPD16162 [Rhodococcus opacus PD630]